MSYRKLLRGVIIIRDEDSEKIAEFLKEYSAEVYIREIKLTEEDCQILGLPLE